MFLKCLLMQLVILFQKCLDYLPQNHMLLNVLSVLTLYQFVLLSNANKLKYVFDFDFPLFRKHCYLSSFQVLLTLPLHNMSSCLYKSPQFHFFVFFYDLVFVACLIVFIIFSCAINCFYMVNTINIDPCLCTLALIFNIVTGFVFASGFSCMTNNSPYTLNYI